jgi:hypothetical protein
LDFVLSGAADGTRGHFLLPFGKRLKRLGAREQAAEFG